MDFQILYTDPALADLEEVIAWSSERYPGGTEEFGMALLDHVDLLKSFPLLGANVKGYRGVRRLLHSPFHIYYRVLPEQKRLEVLHFWHESRQPPRF